MKLSRLAHFTQSLLVLCTTLVFASCTTAPQAPESQVIQEPSRLTVNPSTSGAIESSSTDVVSPGDWITVSQAVDSKLNGKFNVEFDGALKLPYDVTLAVQGLTLSEVRGAIHRAFQRYYQTPLSLDISVGERKRWIEVGGLVTHPGRMLIRKDANLDEVIAAAGGIQTDHTARFVKIESESQVQVISLDDFYGRGDDSGVPDWRGGERVTILRESPEPPVHLLGEVRSPGDVQFKPGADFLYYLNQVQGPTQYANLNKIELIRTRDPQRPSVEFVANAIHQFPTIERGDVLLVHAEKPSFFDRAVQALTALGSMAATIAALVIIL